MGWKDAPLVEESPKWASAPVVGEDQLGGVASEGGKGLLRGASQTAQAVRSGALGLVPGGAALKTLLPSVLPKIGTIPFQELIKSTADTPSEKFAGTAGEIVGGSVVGGGASTLRNAAVTGGAAVGGATGEQLGGDVGKLLGIVAGTYGMSGAIALGRKLGMAVKDVAGAISAASGGEWGIKHLASKAITDKAGTDTERIIEAVKSPTQYVKGSPVTVGEAVTEAQMGKPEQFGGAIVRLQKDLSGAPGVDNIIPSVVKQQAAAVETHLAKLAEKTGPMREAALSSANVGGGVKVKPVLDQIEAIGAEPGLGASKIIKKTLATVKEDIEALSKDGIVNAKDLYTVRKEIGNTIQTHAKETANWDKRLSAGMERRVQIAIDDAIEAAGGKGWKEYLVTESIGRRAVENQELRQKAMKLLQAQVKGQSSGQVVSGEILHPPTLLNRPMMLANYALKLVAMDANAPVVKRVAESMTNPAEFAKLVKLPTSHPDRIAMNYIVNALVSTKMDEALKANPTQ